MMMKEEEKEKEGIEYITLTECNLPNKILPSSSLKKFKDPALHPP